MENSLETKSFSRMVKNEIFKSEIIDKCCIRAEFLGLVLFGAQTVEKNLIRFVTENPDVMGRFVKLARFMGIEAVIRQTNDKSLRYFIELTDTVKIAQILYDMSMLDSSGEIRFRITPDIVKKTCCKRAFLRGAMLGAGIVSDPNKNYNLEIVTSNLGLCDELIELLSYINFDFHKIVRKNKYVAYIKNSEQISDILSLLGAYKSQMELLNIKIEKEIRNDVNRSANSETSNLIKTINASVDQIQAIQKIEKRMGLDNLPDDLREIALLRLDNKDLSLSELGNLLNPPLTKSGVNHRMKKILKYAQ